MSKRLAERVKEIAENHYKPETRHISKTDYDVLVEIANEHEDLVEIANKYEKLVEACKVIKEV